MSVDPKRKDDGGETTTAPTQDEDELQLVIARWA